MNDHVTEQTADQVIVTDDGPVRILRLNRPEKKNALTDAMYDRLSDALDEAAATAAIRCVVITGGPAAFTAGADLNDFLHAARHAEGLRSQAVRCAVQRAAEVGRGPGRVRGVLQPEGVREGAAGYPDSRSSFFPLAMGYAE
jgi:enoyl-CoA hydratase/carnithine racemase